MNNTPSRCSQNRQRSSTKTPSPTPPSPQLLRSKSGAPANLQSSISTSNSSSSCSSTRSRSNAKTRSSINKENHGENNLLSKPRNSTSSNDGFVRFLRRGNADVNDHSNVTIRKAKSTMGSPSAWALSPGRTLNFGLAPTQMESPVVLGAVGTAEKKKVKSGGVSGVLKYFRVKKKVSPMQEEEYHEFRIMNTRLLQWRFVNARAQKKMVAVKIKAEEILFSVWMRILKKRNLMMEKRIEVEKLKQEIKFYQIIVPQMNLLNKWEKLDAKNLQAVSRVSRKLVGISLKVPLMDDTKADLTSLQQAMNMAVETMDDIQANITKFLSQVEKMLYLVTELSSITEQENEYLEEVDKILNLVHQLLEIEGSLRPFALGIKTIDHRKFISDNQIFHRFRGGKNILPISREDDGSNIDNDKKLQGRRWSLEEL
ncbi:hypothetical protein ACFE04_023537 [Oxalis oulophora]